VFTFGLILSSEDVINLKREEERFLVPDLAVLIMKMLVIVYLVKQWNDVIREANKTLNYVNQLRITVNNIYGGPTEEFIQMVS